MTYGGFILFPIEWTSLIWECDGNVWTCVSSIMSSVGNFLILFNISVLTLNYKNKANDVCNLTHMCLKAGPSSLKNSLHKLHFLHRYSCNHVWVYHLFLILFSDILTKFYHQEQLVAHVSLNGLGAFVGVSLEGNAVATRLDTNLQFYGDPYLTTTDILLGTVERPKAAEPLYAALDGLYAKLRCFPKLRS